MKIYLPKNALLGVHVQVNKRIFALSFSLTALLLLFAAGCSSTSKKMAPYTQAKSEDCDDFDNVIRSCAKQIKQPRLFAVLKKISHCETGNKCTGKIDSPTGMYHGPFQYSMATWAGQCQPLFAKNGINQCRSPSAVYDTCCASMCAAAMIAAGGIVNWPTCGR